jgi:hypothetical protein
MGFHRSSIIMISLASYYSSHSRVSGRDQLANSNPTNPTTQGKKKFAGTGGEMSNSESVGDQKRILPIEISENVAQEKLVEVFELSGARSLIAVDLDDVLSQTTKCAAECTSLLIIQLLSCSACEL